MAIRQGEIDGTPDAFVDALFRLGPDIRHESSETRAGYAERIVRGGLPETVARATQPARRDRHLASYLADLINRDVRQIAEIEHVEAMRALLRLLAGRIGQLLVPGAGCFTIGPRIRSKSTPC